MGVQPFKKNLKRSFFEVFMYPFLSFHSRALNPLGTTDHSIALTKICLNENVLVVTDRQICLILVRYESEVGFFVGPTIVKAIIERIKTNILNVFGSYQNCLSNNDIVFVGHSLGAHISGIAAEAFFFRCQTRGKVMI